jgi:hypothetical protein
MRFLRSRPAPSLPAQPSAGMVERLLSARRELDPLASFLKERLQFPMGANTGADEMPPFPSGAVATRPPVCRYGPFNLSTCSQFNY